MIKVIIEPIGDAFQRRVYVCGVLIFQKTVYPVIRDYLTDKRSFEFHTV